MLDSRPAIPFLDPPLPSSTPLPPLPPPPARGSGAIASSATPDIDEALSALTNATERQLIQASRVGPDRARFDAFEALETEGAQANVAFVTVMNWALVGMALFVWARVFAGANAARERAALAAVARSQREAASHKQAAASQRERL